MTPMIDAAEREKLVRADFARGATTYAGRLDAWHALGQVTGEYQTWKDLTKAAKADFQVAKMQLQFNGMKIRQWGIFRIDDAPVRGAEADGVRVTSGTTGVTKVMTYLGPCGKDYGVIQHTDGFEILDALVGQIDGAHYDTMGTLDYGKVVWGQVDPNVHIQVGDDRTDVLLTFHTSHDGSKAFDIYETAVRVVCRNTLRAGSLSRLGASLRVRHTSRAQARISDLKAEVAEIYTVAKKLEDKLTVLAKRKVNRESVTSLFDKLFPVGVGTDGRPQESSSRRNNILSAILERYEANDGNAFPEQRGTAYNLLNAITGWVDHDRGTDAQSATFGQGSTLKTQTLDWLIDHAGEMPEKSQSFQVDFADLGLSIPGLAR